MLAAFGSGENGDGAMRRDVAETILTLMFDYGGKLNDSMMLVRESSDEAEFSRYRRAVGTVLASAFENIVDPLLDEHPDLRPDQLKLEETD